MSCINVVLHDILIAPNENAHGWWEGYEKCRITRHFPSQTRATRIKMPMHWECRVPRHFLRNMSCGTTFPTFLLINPSPRNFCSFPLFSTKTPRVLKRQNATDHKPFPSSLYLLSIPAHRGYSSLPPITIPPSFLGIWTVCWGFVEYLLEVARNLLILLFLMAARHEFQLVYRQCAARRQATKGMYINFDRTRFVSRETSEWYRVRTQAPYPKFIVERTVEPSLDHEL